MAADVDEREGREAIAHYSRLLVELGLLEFKGGNLSVRIGDLEVDLRASALLP